jgi:hypothetical protein
MNEELVSAQGTIILGGKTYLVSRPTEKDIFAVFSNAKKQAKKLYNPFKHVLDAIAGLEIPQETKNALLMQAGKVSSSGEIPEESISEYLTSPAGAAFFAFILIRKNHPEITLEEIQKHITEENHVVIFAELDEASGVNLIHKAFEDSSFFQRA